MSRRMSVSRGTMGLVLVVGVVAGLAGAMGVVIGMNVGAPEETTYKVDWPSVQQLHATATHAGEGFAMATGAVDEDGEGLFILDYLTGDLRGMLLNVRSGKFNSFYEHNVVEDLGTADVKNPKYVLLTGRAAFRDGIGVPRTRLSRSAIYVAELTSGVVAAYAVPWTPGHQQLGRPTKSRFVALDRAKFRDLAIRDQ